MLTVQVSGPFMQTAVVIGTDGVPNIELPICASGTQQFTGLVWSGRFCIR